MNALRVSLHVVGILATVYAALALWLLPWLDFGVAVAISAGCVIGLGLVKAIEADRERQRQYREQVWQRLIDDAKAAYPHLMIIKGGKEPEWLKFVDLKRWPIGDDEERQ